MNNLELTNELERIVKLQYREHGLFVIAFSIAGKEGDYFIQGSYTGTPKDPRGFFACLEMSHDLQKIGTHIPGTSNNLHALNWQEPTEIPNMHLMLDQKQTSPSGIAKCIVTTLEVGLGLKAQEIEIRY